MAAGRTSEHRANTNQLNLSIHNDRVTFITKDYRNRAVKKPVTLDDIEFLRRFTMHILPGRFVKIRRYGMYNPTLIRNHKLQFTPEEKPDIQAILKKQKGPETNRERLDRLTGINPCFCPVCKTGRNQQNLQYVKERSFNLFLETTKNRR